MSLLELPSNRDEAWRWSDLSALPDLVAARPSGRIPGILPFLEADGLRLVFVDGHLDRDRSRADGVSIGPVGVTEDHHPLARLAGSDGWTLDIASSLEGLVQLVHVSTGAADHLAARVRIGEGASARVVETFVGAGWANRFAEVRLAPGARLHLHRRLLGVSGFVSLTDRILLDRNARLCGATLAAGGADSRIDSTVELTGEGAEVEMAGALMARRRERHDANLVVRHARPEGKSRQVWRSVADDRGVCAVAARVEVARDAQKTDGEQSLRGLLLSRGAAVLARPELEIFADDVKCAHGAAVGELDEQALFYLESRGVAPAEAKALLTRAFVADALEPIADGMVRAAFYDDAEGWFA